MTDDVSKIDLRIDNACKVAEEFVTHYFDALDSKRHTLTRLYMDNATLSWDGNSSIGKEAILKFLESLPETHHTLNALDAQPVSIEAVKGQQTVLIHAAGTLKVAKVNVHAFAQSFVVTAQDNKWKIFSDTCRLQRPISDTTSNAVS